MNETKMLSREEFAKMVDTYDDPVLLLLSARQGTIPADRAVEIPEVWPTHATGIRVTYDWDCFDGAVGSPVIALIPRPAPAWTPKIDQPVFYLKEGNVEVGVVKEPYNLPGRWCINQLSNTYWVAWTREIKPLDTSKIGLPWSQI